MDSLCKWNANPMHWSLFGAYRYNIYEKCNKLLNSSFLVCCSCIPNPINVCEMFV